MNAAALASGDKRGGLSATWNKIKFDRQIVAIAKVAGVSAVYTDDENLGKMAETQGIRAITIAELLLPPEDAQMTFAWEVPNEEDNEDPDSA